MRGRPGKFPSVRECVRFITSHEEGMAIVHGHSFHTPLSLPSPGGYNSPMQNRIMGKGCLGWLLFIVLLIKAAISWLSWLAGLIVTLVKMLGLVIVLLIVLFVVLIVMALVRRLSPAQREVYPPTQRDLPEREPPSE